MYHNTNLKDKDLDHNCFRRAEITALMANQLMAYGAIVFLQVQSLVSMEKVLLQGKPGYSFRCRQAAQHFELHSLHGFWIRDVFLLDYMMKRKWLGHYFQLPLTFVRSRLVSYESALFLRRQNPLCELQTILTYFRLNERSARNSCPSNTRVFSMVILFIHWTTETSGIRTQAYEI